MSLRSLRGQLFFCLITITTNSTKDGNESRTEERKTKQSLPFSSKMEFCHFYYIFSFLRMMRLCFGNLFAVASSVYELSSKTPLLMHFEFVGFFILLKIKSLFRSFQASFMHSSDLQELFLMKIPASIAN